MSVPDEGVRDSVPENVKNMLLVLATGGVLTPEWRDARGQSLWELTWSRVHAISSGLNPGLLAAAGVASPLPGSPEGSPSKAATDSAEAGGPIQPQPVSPPEADSAAQAAPPVDPHPGSPGGGHAQAPAPPVAPAEPPVENGAGGPGAPAPAREQPGQEAEAIETEQEAEAVEAEQASNGCKQS